MKAPSNGVKFSVAKMMLLVMFVALSCSMLKVSRGTLSSLQPPRMRPPFRTSRLLHPKRVPFKFFKKKRVPFSIHTLLELIHVKMWWQPSLLTSSIQGSYKLAWFFISKWSTCIRAYRFIRLEYWDSTGWQTQISWYLCETITLTLSRDNIKKNSTYYCFNLILNTV